MNETLLAELDRVGGGRFDSRLNLNGSVTVTGAGHSIRINEADISDVVELLQCQPDDIDRLEVVSILNIGNVVYRPVSV